MSKDIQAELVRLKKGIDEAKNNLAKFEGREQEIFRQLKSEHGLTSIEAIEKEIEKVKKSRADKAEKRDKLFAELAEEYSW